MNADEMMMVIVGMVVLTVNCTTMLVTFPSKRSLSFTVAALLLFSVAFYAILYQTGMIVPNDSNGGLPGLAYLPVMVLLFKGSLFHKVFAYFLQFLLTSSQITLAQTLSGVFVKYGAQYAFAVFAAASLLMLTVYVILVFRYGRSFFNNLFQYGRPAEWAFYSFGAIFSFALLVVSRMLPGTSMHLLLLLVFILWSFAVLCYAIINTHEKSKNKYEAEFARGIISSGRDHYQKMNEMYDKLRIMRHDYKYHLDAISELLSTGNSAETEKYLADVQKQLSDNELPGFCRNIVINALLAGYSERCSRLEIKFGVKISMPESISIPNYEMCIILGNLLENALEACTEQDGVRKIDLVINTQGAHLAVMVKNSFGGGLSSSAGGALPASKKKDGGNGLRSVKAVAERYIGELMAEWNDESFTAYVLVRL